MKKQILKILPYYEPRMWGGGTRLEQEFGYRTDVKPLGEVYNVVALPGHADCQVAGTDLTLSQLYEQQTDWFDCETEQLPIRVNILDPMADLSVQIHPDDEFARKYNGGRGKPEAWVILDTPEDGVIEFGHHARTREEFARWTAEGNWEALLRYLKAEKDGYIEIPAGTLHAIGTGVLTYNISRNADCTLRLYDYDRVDPATGQKRPIQPEAVLENVCVPDRLIEFQQFPASRELGCRVTRYVDEPGLYSLVRVQTDDGGRYLADRFCFITCVKGEGKVNGVPVRQGETILVPAGTGWLELEGGLDLFLAGYRNLNGNDRTITV